MITLIGLMATAAWPQKPEPDEGSDLYKGSDYKGAISKLRGRKDPKGLFYLGQSYEKLGETKKAVSAYEKSVKAGSKIFERALSRRFLGSKDPDKPDLDEFIKKLDPMITFSVGSLSRAVELKASFTKRVEWRDKGNALFAVFEALRAGEKFYSRGEGEPPLKIIAKPRPSYTDAARQHNVTGTVRLLLFFGSDGTVKFARALQTLPHGITGQALTAARKITFAPPSSDGVRGAALAVVEYTFKIY